MINSQSEASANTIHGKRAIEKAATHPERNYWRIPLDKEYTDDPENCFQRTQEQGKTSLEFIGQKEPLKDAEAIFMTPTYHNEWKQGNIQSQLFELLSKDYSSGKGNLEIVYLLNDLGPSKIPKDQDEMQEFLRQFPLKAGARKDSGTDDNIETEDPRPFLEKLGQGVEYHISGEPVESPQAPYVIYKDVDFSKMTKEQFERYKQLSLGESIPYPDYLHKYTPEKADDVVQINNEIIALFTDVARIQKLGRLDTTTNPILYRHTMEKAAGIISTYDNNRELQEIIRLSFAQAKNVDISLLNLLNVEFTKEGYADKGIASIRTIGMDYAQERYPEKPRMIVQPLDGDEVPSTSFVQKMTQYYETTGLECTQVPIVTMALPGLTRELTETGVDKSLFETYVSDFSPLVTRIQSMTADLAKEIGAVKGEPWGVGRDEDYFLGRKMKKFASTVGGTKYTAISELPPVAICMVDREGWVDGADRGHLKVTDEKYVGVIMDNELSDMKYRRYMSEKEYDNWKSEAELNSISPPEYSVINAKYKEYLEVYYREICLPQNERNRSLFTYLAKLRISGGLIIGSKSIEIKNWEDIPDEDIFDVSHFVNHSSKLLQTMTDADWKYVNYLLSGEEGIKESTSDMEEGKLSDFQISMREYIGIPATPTDIAEIQPINRNDRRANADNKSYVYSTMARKLAFELCEQNFFHLKIDPAADDLYSGGPIDPIYDDFENRAQGIRLAVAHSQTS